MRLCPRHGVAPSPFCSHPACMVPAQNDGYASAVRKYVIDYALPAAGWVRADIGTNCSHDATRATGLEGQAEGVEAAGVPFQLRARARASSEALPPLASIEFPQVEKGPLVEYVVGYDLADDSVSAAVLARVEADGSLTIVDEVIQPPLPANRNSEKKRGR